jgi:hypothetical protein
MYSIERYRNILLEPLPLSMRANNIVGPLITHLTLRVFCVEGGDLTLLLQPFSNLTYLSLSTSSIRTLPRIPTLRTLLLRDILLQGLTDGDNNVFDCIQDMDVLETLTLDNAVGATFPDHGSRDLNNGRGWDIVNTSVRNLTLGFYEPSIGPPYYNGDTATPINALADFTGALHTMFPNVSQLTLNYTKETEEPSRREGISMYDGIQAQWNLETIRARVKDVEVAQRSEAAVRACKFLDEYFAEVPNKLVLIECVGSHRRKPWKFLFGDDEDPHITYSYTIAV